MKKSMTGAVTLAILLLISAVAFAIHSSNSRTAVRPAMAPPALCSTPVQTTCSGRYELDFPSISAHSTAEITISLSGTEHKDEVIVTPTEVPENGLVWVGYVDEDETATLRMANVTGSAINPANRDYRITVNHYGN